MLFFAFPALDHSSAVEMCRYNQKKQRVTGDKMTTSKFYRFFIGLNGTESVLFIDA